MSDPVTLYLDAIHRKLKNGDATEHTHRAALQSLIERTIDGLEATNEPKSQQRENKPDYVVRRHQTVIGYVEAKDIDQPLRDVIKTGQIKRYLDALPNLIVTNYLNFMWFVSGEKRMEVSLGDFSDKGLVMAESATANWQTLMKSFASEVSPILNTPNQLAHALAGQTRLLRDLVHELTDSGNEDLQNQREAFKALLVPDLQSSDFADMYAQTATYGLFTARVFEYTTIFELTKSQLPRGLRQQTFSLEKAVYLIPKANPFLREFFQHIASPNLSEQLRWLIEQIANSLNYTDIQRVLEKQGRRQGFEDPVFHFYETFLAAYNPKLREQRGVYYTPEPVVDFIVRSVDALLMQDFDRPSGLADPETLILDPATGTATFLRRVIEAIHQRITTNGNSGVWPSYVNEHLLPRVFGFELMMAPYTVAHLKLALHLQETGAILSKTQRLHVYLTNTLDRLQHQTQALLGQWIAKENEGAEKIKRHEPVQVVLGNPPYSGESKNKGAFIMALLDEYKKEPSGAKLQEKNSKWINDDYVKFIRFAHDRILRTGHGIVGFITNHSWLDNPTFRGMRASLMRDFDDIYVIDLHGNTKKKERTPEHLNTQGVDKNVFDIEQGVAITFLVKRPQNAVFELEIQDNGTATQPSTISQARIHHAEVWGSREHKYEWLHANDVTRTSFAPIKPALPHLLFVPRDATLAANYDNWWKVTTIMPLNSVGIVTARDHLCIQFTRRDLEETIKQFNGLPVETARQVFKLGKDARDWRIEWAQNDLRQARLAPEHFQAVCYRPFDQRQTFYTGVTKGFHCMPRAKVMNHMVTTIQNLGLAVGRAGAVIGDPEWNICLITNYITEFNLFRRGGNNLFPLWLSFNGDQPIPNFNPHFLNALATALRRPTDPNAHDLPMGITPEDVLAYLYAVLYSPSYRKRYAEFLKSDFPRIPLSTVDGSPFADAWATLVPLGHQLIDLHLMRKMPSPLKVQFPKTGTNEVTKPRFEMAPKAEYGRIWINEAQYFDRVPPLAWAYRIGGYQVCEKWLKDRKGRILSFDDIHHYQQMVAVLDHTQAVQQAIDVASLALWA